MPPKKDARKAPTESVKQKAPAPKPTAKRGATAPAAPASDASRGLIDRVMLYNGGDLTAPLLAGQATDLAHLVSKLPKEAAKELAKFMKKNESKWQKGAYNEDMYYKLMKELDRLLALALAGGSAIESPLEGVAALVVLAHQTAASNNGAVDPLLVAAGLGCNRVDVLRVCYEMLGAAVTCGSSASPSAAASSGSAGDAAKPTRLTFCVSNASSAALTAGTPLVEAGGLGYLFGPTRAATSLPTLPIALPDNAIYHLCHSQIAFEAIQLMVKINPRVATFKAPNTFINTFMGENTNNVLSQFILQATYTKNNGMTWGNKLPQPQHVVDAALFLVDSGAECTRRDMVYLATCAGLVSVVERLIQKGADRTAACVYDEANTPLVAAKKMAKSNDPPTKAAGTAICALLA